MWSLSGAMVVNTRKLVNSDTYLWAQPTQRTARKEEKAHRIKNELANVCITTLWHVYIRLYLLGYPNSPILFRSQTAHSWRFNVNGNNETYLFLHVTCLILTKFGISSETCKPPNIEIWQKSVHNDICGRTEEWTARHHFG